MLSILLVTSRPEIFHSFCEAMSSDLHTNLQKAATGAAALMTVRSNPPDLVVIDSTLPDISPLGLVKELLMVNALVNTAVASPLSKEEFHDASEGLGILAKLPAFPSKDDAADLVQKLRVILGKTTRSDAGVFS